MLKRSKKSKKTNLYLYVFAVILMLLTVINIASYLTPKNRKVLGLQTKSSDVLFWYQFLEKNPKYVPGWIEIGRPDKVKVLDPNYF